MERTWLNEFGVDFAIPAEILSAVESGKLEDESWHNDVCPSFSRYLPAGDGSHMQLFVDHPDPSERELGKESSRFFVLQYPANASDDEPIEIYSGDDVVAALAAILPEQGA